jgi:Flp pilus assembly protein TadG
VKISRRHIEPTSERGQAMPEFAVVLPVLCLVLFAIIQLGAVWNDYIAVTDASRTGARKAAVSRHTDPSDGCDTARASAGDLNQDRLSCNVAVDGPLDRPGADVTVRVTYPYSINLVGFVVAEGSLEAETTERME